MTFDPIPSEIAEETVRQQNAMGWPDMVPGYSELPAADGRVLWRHWDDLKAGICEQLVEHHTRLARQAIAKWKQTRSTVMLRRAAKNILHARIYRCKYLTLMGRTESTEADMPFPCASKEEIEQMEQGE